MTQPTPPVPPMKRPRYFDYQFLRADDFDTEQRYHRSRRELLTALFYSPGVVSGLTPTTTDTALTVGAGYAVDHLGRLIVLAAPAQLVPPTADGPLLIAVRYDERATDPSDETGFPGETRWTEEPRIELVASAAPGHVVLGTFKRAAGKATVDTASRTTAGLVIPGQYTVKGALTVDGDISGKSLRTGPVTATGAVTATGDVTGVNLKASGGVTATGDVTGVNLKASGGVTATGDVTGVNLKASGGVTATGDVSAKNLRASAEVSAKDVRATGAITPSAGNSSANGIMFPRDPGGGSGDEAYIRYFPYSGESTMLAIGTGNDADDLIDFWQFGQVRLRIGQGMLHMGRLDGSITAGNEVIGAIGFQGQGVQHAQFSFRAGRGFELVDRSADGPSPSYPVDSKPYANLYTRSVKAAGGLSVGAYEPVDNRITAWDGVYHGGLYVGDTDDLGACPIRMYNNGDIRTSGIVYGREKKFLIDHPLDPEHQNLIHCAVEGPESGVYYRGEARLVDGTATVELPDYFEALTLPEDRTVQLTPLFEDDDEPVSALAASRVKDGRFRVRTLDGSRASHAFCWEVKAVRADVERLDVEVDKQDFDEQPRIVSDPPPAAPEGPGHTEPAS
ncbi:hypothetical protein ACFYWX_39660 [Streptomyces sp. NPDC002888]|uniref:hypothetical protein n=1 Tax=Streptomyces sp. NPDC002888 TaxID=3364668 RepID=UPI003678294F